VGTVCNLLSREKEETYVRERRGKSLQVSKSQVVDEGKSCHTFRMKGKRGKGENRKEKEGDFL